MNDTCGVSPIRHSHAVDQQLVTDPETLAKVEAINSLRQFDAGMEILTQWLSDGKEGFRLRFTHLLTLNRIVLEGVSRFAGTFRTGPIYISNSKHQPPPPTEVPLLVEDFCDYLTSNFVKKSALHLAAYALWRLNWIHPFVDGNGRTARIVSYIVLSAKLGYKLPGYPTIPELIAEHKAPYYEALEAADDAFSKGKIDVSAVEKLLGEHLAQQLINLHDSASQDGPEMPKGAEALSSPIDSDVEYKYRDTTYRPIYILNVEDALRTARSSNSNTESWFERNQALFTGLMTILASLISAALTYYLK